jgi:HEAT repeat protein
VRTRAGAGELGALIAELSSDNAVARDGAVARLMVIGARAVDRLVAVVDAGPPQARAPALRALEGIANARALPSILRAIDEPDQTIAIAALGAAAAQLDGARGPDVLDRLSGVALDIARADAVRVAAMEAIARLDRATIEPLFARLATDPSDVVRQFAAASGRRPADAVSPASVLADAAAGRLPDDPRLLRAAIAETGHAAALPQLLRILERVREREAAEPAARRAEWLTTRAAAHAALAARESRLALYDLREALEGAQTPLPVEFLTALTQIGDASCVEPIAAAYARAKDAWWRRHLAETFRAIVRREHLTRRHAAMKRIEKRWPAVLSSS